jgi:hypothetical protein
VDDGCLFMIRCDCILIRLVDSIFSICILYIYIYLRICLSHYCALPASANTAWDPFWEQECSPFPPVTVGPTVIYSVFGANAWQIDTPRRRCNKHEQQKNIY